MSYYIGVFFMVWPIVLFLWTVLAMVRNTKVSKLRDEMIDRIVEVAEMDIHAGRDHHWRWDVFESVPYWKMVWQVWRPLDSFYPDKAFLEPPQKSVHIGRAAVRRAIGLGL